MPRQLVPFLLFLLTTTVANAAALKFAETERTVTATPQDRELQARYTFTNTGAEPVWLVQITTSCGCAKAVSDKTEYQPGETGTITATYTIGLSQGRHAHTIAIQTSEPDTPPHVLKITADLPAGTPVINNPTSLIATPRELTWTREPYATKTVALALNNLPSAKIATACDSDQFELKLDTSAQPYALHVTPRPGTAAIRAEITLTATAENGPPATLTIPLVIVSLKSLRAK